MKTCLRIVVGAWLIAQLTCLCGCQITNPIDAVRLNRKAQVYIKYGHYDRAAEVLTASLDADFENPASHYWLGQCYETQGRQDKAIYEYRLAVRFAPSMELAQRALITILHRTDRVDESILATKSFLQYKSGPAYNVMRLAETFVAQEMEQQAILAYQRAQQLEPTNPKPSLALADYYFDRADEEKGIDYLTQAFMADPLYPGLARRLGEHGRRVEIPEPPMFHVPSALQRELAELEQ